MVQVCQQRLNAPVESAGQRSMTPRQRAPVPYTRPRSETREMDAKEEEEVGMERVQGELSGSVWYQQEGSSEEEESVEMIETRPPGPSPSLLSPSLSLATAVPLDHAISADDRMDALSAYCARYSSPEPEHLAALRAVTEEMVPMAARMLSGPLQGR